MTVSVDSYLAYWNNATMNVELRYLFTIVILFPLDMCPEVGLLEYMVLLF